MAKSLTAFPTFVTGKYIYYHENLYLLIQYSTFAETPSKITILSHI
jgi:hypothetical protein